LEGKFYDPYHTQSLFRFDMELGSALDGSYEIVIENICRRMAMVLIAMGVFNIW